MKIKTCKVANYIDVSELKHHPKNHELRNISDERLQDLKQSIIKKGLYEPLLVWSQDNMVLAGNQRLKAIRELIEEGYTFITPSNKKNMIPVVIEEVDEVRAIEILHQANNHHGSWAEEKLAQAIKEAEAMGIETVDLGYSEDYIKRIMSEAEELTEKLAGRVATEKTEGLTDEDAVPVLPSKTVSKLGDLWLLGAYYECELCNKKYNVKEAKKKCSCDKKAKLNLKSKHRLLVGDSGDPKNIARLLNGETAQLVFTDPPYNQTTTGGHKGAVGEALRKQGKDIDHLCDFDPKAFLEVLPTVFKKNTINTYIFCNKDLVPDYLDWAVKNKYSFNILVWKKPNAIPIGGSHRPDVEYMLLFRKSAVWNDYVEGVNYSKCLEFSRETSKDHPTMKPVGLIENELQISSEADGLVMDFFIGSGSTIIAAEKTNRRCSGMELSEKYADVSLQRYLDFTGIMPILETGEEFKRE